MIKDQEFLAVSTFGKTANGQVIEKVSLTNSLGMRVQYIDYACTLLGIEVKDQRGNFKNIVLNLPNLPSYLQTKRRFAAVMGRYAGRIDNGSYTLNGVTYQLPINANGVALHSDPGGFDRKIWQRQDFLKKHSCGSIFTLFSPSFDQGHPGNVHVEVTYELMRNRNEFRIHYHAQTDTPTHLSLTNHAFFNLAGAGSKGLDSHFFQINADRYLETNQKKIPTGRMLSVEGSALDFRIPKSIGKDLKSLSIELGNPPEYDHTFALSNFSGKLRLAARVFETQSSRLMTIKTSEPAIQFFTGNGFDKSEMGGEGVAYDKHDGFALETFHYPDSPNQAHFPSTLVTPEKPLKSKTVFLFDVLT